MAYLAMRYAPPGVRREKPRVSAFTSADIPKILALEPDLVLTFSDLQAEIVAELIRAGVTVMAYNQRDIAGILAMIRHLGATVGEAERAARLAESYSQRIADISARSHGKARAVVYFEEWDSPMISGINWVSELIEIAGGREAFPELARKPAARDRFVTSQQRQMLFWRLGVAKRSAPRKSVRGPAGKLYRLYDMGASSRSNHRLSCSRARQP